MMKISGQTNILSFRFGSGSIKGIGQEIGKFVVVTMDIPWNVTKNLLGGTPEQVIFVIVSDTDNSFGLVIINSSIITIQSFWSTIVTL